MLIFVISTSALTLYAQDLSSVLFNNSGLHFGLFRGQTEFSNERLNYSFRVQSRHYFNQERFGEFSLGSGAISGLGYRTQITPLDYRLGFHSTNFGIDSPRLFGVKSPLYFYAGAGLLYSTPFEVQAPNDPLTPDLGNTLTTSSFWDFDGGVAPFIPVGLGLDIPLQQNFALSFNGGYNQTLSALKFTSNDVPRGYWGFTIGLRLHNPPVRSFPPIIVQKAASVQTSALDMPDFEIPIVRARDLSGLILAGLNRRSINFDVLSSEIQTEDQQWLSKTRLIIALNPESRIHIKGHADSTGIDQVNEMISESRSRAVWLALAESGIETKHIEYSWYSDQNPVSDNQTKDGRFQNRRVEFEIRDLDVNEQRDQRSAFSEIKDFEINEPIDLENEIRFEWLELSTESANATFAMVTNMMEANPELHVFAGSVSGSYEGSNRLLRELDKARSDKVKANLIEFGVQAERILTYNPYSVDNAQIFEQYTRNRADQQTFIIPFIPSENEE